MFHYIRSLYFVISALLLLVGVFFYVEAETARPDFTLTTTEELVDADEITKTVSILPRVLPGNPLYFFKNAGQGVRSFFTFNKERRAELELRYASERLAEARTLADRGDVARAAGHLQRYQENLDRVDELAEDLGKKNPDAGKKFTGQVLKAVIDHQKVLGRLERTVSSESVAAVQAVRAHTLERAGSAVGRLDLPTLTALLNDSLTDNGSPFKPLRDLEILKAIEAKAPIEAKPAIQRAEENAIKNLTRKLESLPAEQKKFLADYVEKSGGDEIAYIKIFDTLEATGMTNETLSEVKAAKEKVFIRLEKKAKEAAKESPEKVKELLSPLADGSIEDLRTLKDIEKRVPEIAKPLSEFKNNAVEKLAAELEKKKLAGEVLPSTKPAGSPERKMCPRVFFPVCGEDGITYTNECNAEVSHVKIVYVGQCKEEPKKAAELRKKPEFVTSCTQEKNPVCGVNNITYLNECFAKDARVSIQYEGACKSASLKEKPIKVSSQAKKIEEATITCTKENAPVCGVNNLTYLNSCFAKQSNAAVQYSGICKTGTKKEPPVTSDSVKTVPEKTVTSGISKTETATKIGSVILPKKLFDDSDIALAKKDEIEKKPNPLGVKKKRAVKFNPGEFLSGQTKKSNIALDLFPDKMLNATRREVKEKSATNYVWKGRVDGESKSSVAISVKGSTVNGIIRSLNGDYEIRSEGDDSVSIREIDRAVFTRHSHETPRRSGTVTARVTPPPPAIVATVTDVDVLFAYTTQAYQRYFNTRDAVEGTIESYIEDANNAFENSGILVRLRSAGTPVEVSYTESGESSTDLNRLATANDGFMDNLHALRDQRNADLVVLFERESADDCGRGYVMNRDNWDFFETRTFAVVRFTCLSMHALAHEVGHIFGAAHDRNNSEGLVPYETFGYGFRNTVRRDIMAYSCEQVNCVMWPYFANPRNLFDNDVVLGSATEDVARAINNTREIIAGFRGGSMIPRVNININNFLR